MRRCMSAGASALRALGMFAVAAALPICGCGDDGYDGKPYGQDFEKPANVAPAEGLPKPELKRDKSAD